MPQIWKVTEPTYEYEEFEKVLNSLIDEGWTIFSVFFAVDVIPGGFTAVACKRSQE